MIIKILKNKNEKLPSPPFQYSTIPVVQSTVYTLPLRLQKFDCLKKLRSAGVKYFTKPYRNLSKKGENYSPVVQSR